MIKRILPLALLSAVIMSAGCKNGSGDFTKLHGIEYKIVKDTHGKKAAMGDFIEMNIVAKADTTLLGSTWKEGHPVPARVDTPAFRGDYKAVLPMLAAGDSAVVRVACDTIMKAFPGNQGRMPPWMKKGHFITFNISVISVKTMDEYKKEMDDKKNAQVQADDKILEDYFAKNNIKAQKTASGLYYTISTPGTGDQITAGQIASLKYTGRTIDGKPFDSNVDTSIGHHGTTPLTFPVGAHRMIPGVDEGVALLKKGSKATLYLPSSLGYGEQGSQNIPPNAVLIFDVEVTDVKAGGPAGNPQMPPPQQ